MGRTALRMLYTTQDALIRENQDNLLLQGSAVQPPEEYLLPQTFANSQPTTIIQNLGWHSVTSQVFTVRMFSLTPRQRTHGGQ